MPENIPKAETADWRKLYPYAPHWLEVDHQRMHYLDEGPTQSAASAAPTLLFIHGNPTWSFHWRSLIASLRNDFRCIAPDHLGCGLSEKPAHLMRLSDHIDHLTSFIEQLDLREVTLVAQDWGGAIGLGALLRMPARLERIVLFNTGAFPPETIPTRIRACRIPMLGRLAVQGAGLFSHAALHMTLARRPKLDPAVAAGYLAPYDSWSNPRAVYGFVHDIPGHHEHPTWYTLAD